MADIDMSGLEFTPIGHTAVNFRGTFDGNGKRIQNLSYNESR